MPRRVRASPSRKTMSPSRSTLRPHVRQRAIAGFMGSGGSCPADRARVAAGPQKLPVHAGGFIQSVASSAPCSSFQSAIIQQQNQSKVSLRVRQEEIVQERSAELQAPMRSGETSVQGADFDVVAEAFPKG